MIHIPSLPLNSRTIQMREISIGDALSIASMPEHLREAGTTRFLSAVMQSGDNPGDWTVEERMMCVAHYLAAALSATGEDQPNFSLGESRFMDYFHPQSSAVIRTADAGAVAGHSWTVRQLTGRMAETIERVSDTPFPGAAKWTIGRLAFQMRRDDDPDDESTLDADIERSYIERLEWIKALPESEFMALLMAWEIARHGMLHLFKVSSDDQGIVALHKGGAGNPPARFPIRSCFGRWAQDNAGKPE